MAYLAAAAPMPLVCIILHSVNAPPPPHHVLIHWTASILLCVIQFRKCHYVQIIETGLILHVERSSKH